ncbi:hypothetical protein NIES592_14040 [Fischerella major NIES-592]|uniref:Uncharacterized protein n=1 Tax=Fischerella major NIES-592 TaxID=210994 RepID=A0A1U7GZ75_9CYAN|nr:hypothetical protein NIES592_14040 [Fischerella major NIES-592]
MVSSCLILTPDTLTLHPYGKPRKARLHTPHTPHTPHTSPTSRSPHPNLIWRDALHCTTAITPLLIFGDHGARNLCHLRA